VDAIVPRINRKMGRYDDGLPIGAIAIRAEVQ
jgi:hypothetical protein